jgi:hypothetical protein
LLLLGDGKPWLATQIKPYDAANDEETYKVFTHIYDFLGAEPVTKGMGGKYTHHRGMFIGWNKTVIGDQTWDTWHMKGNHQTHEAWLSKEAGADKAVQSEKISWITNDGKPLIEEVRTISAMAGADGMRIFDFDSTLTSKAGPIQLRGDLQHAGMHVRMANEVSEHEDTTNYILPEGAEEQDNDQVAGAWWVRCSPVVRGTRYWVMHMTAPDTPGGVPVYSIRRYARFGSFFEPDIQEGSPLALRFRIVVSEKELDRAACQALYDEYAEKQGGTHGSR